MPADPFYKTNRWRRLREQRLQIDSYKCTVRGCPERASVVDHKVPRKDGGADVLHNLRSLCDAHDRQVKERPNRKRANGGVFRDVDASGNPVDPNHEWHDGGRIKHIDPRGKDRHGSRRLS